MTNYAHSFNCRGNDPDCPACCESGLRKLAETAEPEPKEQTYSYAQLQAAVTEAAETTATSYGQRIKYIRKTHSRKLFGWSLFWGTAGWMLGMLIGGWLL